MVPYYEPPFRGHIETTYDALLIFEAARKGIVPRITRRLTEVERSMIGSGSCFIFDEHESGIKRWTDGLVWSPSRILGNFLVSRFFPGNTWLTKMQVYREVDKRPNSKRRSPKKSKSKSKSKSPNAISPDQAPYMSIEASISPLVAGHMDGPLGSGQLPLRDGSEIAGMDRQRERQLVGSLTSAYAFKPEGLVKKVSLHTMTYADLQTMSIKVNGYTQHLVSYYSLDDVNTGKLRAPSTIPEFQALDIDEDFLDELHFRFPPQVERGLDGKVRWVDDHAEKLAISTSANNAIANELMGPLYTNDPYGNAPAQPVLRLGHRQDQAPGPSRTGTMPQPINIPQAPPMEQPYYGPGSAGSGMSYMGPGSASSGQAYYDQMSPNDPSHMRSSHQVGSRGRPPSSSRSNNRYGPYPVTSPRAVSSFANLDQHRRSSGPVDSQGQPYTNFDVKPVQMPNGQFQYPEPQQQPSSYYGPPAQARNYGSPIHDQIANTPHSWSTSLPHEGPRHANGFTPPMNTDVPLYNAHAGPSNSAGSRPSTGPDQVTYQAPPPPPHHPQQWPTTAPAWDPIAQGPHGPGQNAYQHPHLPPPQGPHGLQNHQGPHGHGSHGLHGLNGHSQGPLHHPHGY